MKLTNENPSRSLFHGIHLVLGEKEIGLNREAGEGGERSGKAVDAR